MEGQSRAQFAIFVALAAVLIIFLLGVKLQPDNAVPAMQLPAPTPSVTF
jgi:hypothetical protein